MIELSDPMLLMSALAPILLIGLARVAALVKPSLAFVFLFSCLGLMTLTLVSMPLLVYFQESSIVRSMPFTVVNWGLWALTSIGVSVLWIAIVLVFRNRSNT